MRASFRSCTPRLSADTSFGLWCKWEISFTREGTVHHHGWVLTPSCINQLVNMLVAMSSLRPASFSRIKAWVLPKMLGEASVSYVPSLKALDIY